MVGCQLGGECDRLGDVGVGLLVCIGVKLRFRTEMLGPKSCEALASTCRLRHSLDGCLKFRRSRRSRRVWSQAEKKLKESENKLREVGC